jgi:CPA2 family monovalent cation:H+ antiporter-2/glutathione-regulated potassium-efflux system protein KefB
MFVFAGLFTVLASAALMEALGLSTALGAFIAGVMLADSPYRHELEADVEPFRSILLGLFFLSIGMVLNLHAIAERPLFVVTMAAALIVAKAVIIGGLALAARMQWRQALALGLLLSQGGEFGFVLFAQAQNAMLVAPEAASLFGAVITLSMATTPFLMMATRGLRAEAAPSSDGLETPNEDGAGAIVIGYGRFGQTVAQMLLGQGVSVTLIDTDVEMIRVAGTFGAKVYYGDGTRLDLLRQAGAADAHLLLFCTDGDPLDAAAVRAIASAFPEARIFIRTFDRRGMIKLDGAPYKAAVREVFESAIRMARLALEELGLDDEAIDNSEADYRERDADRLKRQAETGDMHAADDRMITHRTITGEECG